jgi:ribosomal protein L11 methyltransferase
MTQQSGRWYELTTWADHEAVESVAELLARFGFNEGVAIEEPFSQEPDGDNLTIDTTRPAIIRTYIPAESFDPGIIDQIHDGLWHLGQMRSVGELTVTERSEEDWASAWKEHYRPFRASERFVIRPPWFDYIAKASDIVLVLDPGMAFGTGMHPTTRLSLLQVEKFVKQGQSLLDVGTGSGILALAAARIGARPIDAVDIEPMSIRVARSNLDLNDAGDAIHLAIGSADWATSRARKYEVVVANIIARVLISIAADLRATLVPGGMLLMSGIIEPKERETRAAFEDLDLELLDRNQTEDWISLAYRAPD